jgi:tetratricopeptide (TPR) repeat protein
MLIRDANSISVVYIPLPKNHQFIGRQRALETLHQKLFTARDCQKLAVVGLGGIGKTQVVLSFAYTVMEQQRDVSIFWVPAVSAETFERAMGEIAKKLGIRTAADKNEDVKEDVKAYLSGPQAGKWLLIVDNADDMHVVENLLPYLPYSAAGSVIFTTRTTAVAQQLVGSNTIELVKLQPDEAIQLLTHALNRKEFLQETSVVTDFFEELGYVPLAITQAAAYLNINTNLSIAEYLRLIRGTDDDKAYLLSKEIRDHTRYEQSSNAIARTWIVSFEQIQERDSEAADLLQFIACIEWKDIPHSILPAILPKARMLEAIGTLSSYAFVSKRTDGMAYEMHRLVHLACWIWLRENGKLHDTQLRVVAHLAAIFPTPSYVNDGTWRAYTPHAARVRKQQEHDGRGVEMRAASQLYYKVGYCLLEDGRTKEALQWLHHSCRFRAALAEDHPDRLESQHVLALAHIANVQIKEAIQMLEQVVTIKKTSLAEDHPDRRASQYVLARAYEINGQTKEAIQILEQVVTIQKKTSLAEDHPDRLASQYVLARAYKVNGQTKKAIQILEQVVTIQKKTSLAEHHPSRLVSQHELARAYRANGQAEEAVQLLEQVVKIENTSLAEDHPLRLRLVSQHELAISYRANGQTEEAVQLLEQVVKIDKTSLAEDHPLRLVSQYELAIAYRANGQTREAIQLLEQVVTIYKTSLADNNPNRLISERALARAVEASKRLEESQPNLPQHAVTE